MGDQTEKRFLGGQLGAALLFLALQPRLLGRIG